jgi:hypothetical protein
MFVGRHGFKNGAAFYDGVNAPKGRGVAKMLVPVKPSDVLEPQKGKVEVDQDRKRQCLDSSNKREANISSANKLVEPNPDSLLLSKPKELWALIPNPTLPPIADDLIVASKAPIKAMQLQ